MFSKVFFYFFFFNPHFSDSLAKGKEKEEEALNLVCSISNLLGFLSLGKRVQKYTLLQYKANIYAFFFQKKCTLIVKMLNLKELR